MLSSKWLCWPLLTLAWLIAGAGGAAGQTIGPPTATTTVSTVPISPGAAPDNTADPNAEDPMPITSNGVKVPDLAGSNDKTGLELYGWGPLATIDHTLGYLPADLMRRTQKIMPDSFWGVTIMWKGRANAFLQWSQNNPLYTTLSRVVLSLLEPMRRLYVDYRPHFVALAGLSLLVMWMGRRTREMNVAIAAILGVMLLGAVFYQQTETVVQGGVKLPILAAQEITARLATNDLQVNDVPLTAKGTFQGDPGRNSARVLYNRDYFYNGVLPFCQTVFGDLEFAFRPVPENPDNPDSSFRGLSYCEYLIKAKSQKDTDQYSYVKGQVKKASAAAYTEFQGHDQDSRTTTIYTSLPAIWGHTILDYVAGMTIIVAELLYLLYCLRLGVTLLAGIVPWWRQLPLNDALSMLDMLWRRFSVIMLLSVVYLLSAAIYPLQAQVGWDAMQAFQFCLVILAIGVLVVSKWRHKVTLAAREISFELGNDTIGSKVGDYAGTAIDGAVGLAKVGALALAPEAAIAASVVPELTGPPSASVAPVMPSEPTIRPLQQPDQSGASTVDITAAPLPVLPSGLAPVVVSTEPESELYQPAALSTDQLALERGSG